MRTTFIVSQLSSRKAAAWELNGWKGICSFTEARRLAPLAFKTKLGRNETMALVSETKPSWSRKDFSVIDNHPIDIGRVRTVVRHTRIAAFPHLRQNHFPGSDVSLDVGFYRDDSAFPFNEPENGHGRNLQAIDRPRRS
jgi:hypothetical protein